ncbi:trem-like transcript 1 protein [Fukomys damarensis]|uniref:trem-like transcript 1 protein n=1 Tax=Fukomys damarensis TaxID=885580 RepID=UPI000540299B|nr:trem-like transcript 1 protein [Fukomys damarensis]
MGPSLLLLLLLLLGLEGWGSADSHPEVLRAPVGASIQLQCHYRLQDIRARKVWCRFVPEGCQPLVSSAVDRSALGSSRTFLTDVGGGLLQVEIVSLQEEDTGQYGCLVEGAAGPHLVHTFALEVLPKDPGLGEEKEEQKEEEEEEIYGTGTQAEDPFLGSEDGTSHWGLSQHKSIPLTWGIVLLLGLLVAAVALFVVMARRKGNTLGVRDQFQSSRASDTDLSSTAHHVDDSGQAAGLPLDVRLDLSPSFDNSTYTNLAFEPPSGKAPTPPLPSPPALPPKVVMSSKPVTYATVTFLGGDRGGVASSELIQDPPSSPSPPS